MLGPPPARATISGRTTTRAAGRAAPDALRLVDSKGTCAKTERASSWNQRGVGGTKGVAGPAGTLGATGSPGTPGPRGLSAWDVIPAGTTVTGEVDWDAQQTATSDDFSVSVALPGIGPVGLTNSTVSFAPDGNGDRGIADPPMDQRV